LNKLTKSPWKGSVGPLLISEIGGNHEGDFDVAKNMVQLAIGSGSDCVKLQLYTGDGLVSAVESPARNQHFKKFELSKDQHLYLAQMCREAGVSYNASVWEIEMLDWIDEHLDFYKIGSGDLTAWPILQVFAKKNKPILLSTGLSTLQEVLDTVAFIQSVNPSYKDPNMLCLLQCTSMYPIPLSDANLNVMTTYRNETGLSVGYSDHTEGMDALKVAAAMGASVLEYHFTDTRDGKEFRDHKVSLTPEELENLKIELTKLMSIKGSGIKTPTRSELEENHRISFRRAVYLRRDVKEGEIILASDLIFLRPANGTDVRDVDSVVGATTLRDIKAYHAIIQNQDYS
jgi:sialic acid synthase SpsE